MGEGHPGKYWAIKLDKDGITFQESVVKKKEEFNCYLSPSHLLRYPVLSSCDQDSWLLSRLSPNSGCKEDTNRPEATEDQAKDEIDNDSGMDSLQEDHGDNCIAPIASDDRDCLIQSDEMQEVRLKMRARNCTTSKVTIRPRIPVKLCKVTKV